MRTTSSLPLAKKNLRMIVSFSLENSTVEAEQVEKEKTEVLYRCNRWVNTSQGRRRVGRVFSSLHKQAREKSVGLNQEEVSCGFDIVQMMIKEK